MRPVLLFLLLLVIATVGCGARSEEPDAAAASDAATTESDAGSDAGAAPTACEQVEAIDRSCASDDDCAIGLHQTDCCGSVLVFAYRATEQPIYAARESECQASYPACMCAPMFPVADSGEPVSDSMDAQAACVTRGGARQCQSYVSMRPADEP